MEYDFRSRFGCGLAVIGHDMSLTEAARHVERIRSDPSSALAAELEGWEYPVSRVEALLMDLWDLTAALQSKRPPTYPRPWKTAGDAKQRGNAAGRSPEEMKALLKQHFGQPEAPI